jgi:hypothetical protein
MPEAAVPYDFYKIFQAHKLMVPQDAPVVQGQAQPADRGKNDKKTEDEQVRQEKKHRSRSLVE